MTDKKARKMAIEDFIKKRGDMIADSRLDGCHGVIGLANDRKILNELITDYLEYRKKGSNKKPYVSHLTESYGCYPNKPEWNF